MTPTEAATAYAALFCPCKLGWQQVCPDYEYAICSLCHNYRFGEEGL